MSASQSTSISLEYFIEKQSHVIYITISVVLAVFLLYDLIINFCWIHKKNSLKTSLARDEILIIPQRPKKDQLTQNSHANTGKLIKQIEQSKYEQKSDLFEGMKMIDGCMIEQMKENFETGINFSQEKVSANNWNIINKWVLFSGLRSSLEFYSPILIAFLLIFAPQFTLKSFSSNATEQQISELQNKTLVKTSAVVALLILSVLSFIVFNIVKAFLCEDSTLQGSYKKQQNRNPTSGKDKKDIAKKRANRRKQINKNNDQDSNFSSKKNLLSANIRTSNIILTKMESNHQSSQINCKSELINIQKIKRRLKSHYYLGQLIYLAPLLVSIGLAISKIL